MAHDSLSSCCFPSRRDALRSIACGFGMLAFKGLFSNQALAGESSNPLAPRAGHHAAKAKRIIFLFMRGGPSQMDSFDYKPKLQESHDKALPFALPRLQVEQKRNLGKLMASPFKWKQYGDCGLPVSELFPKIAKHADDLCVINSLHTDGVDHGQATNRLHTGQDTFIRPSLGSWVLYGLGSENQNLPGFISLCPLKGEVGNRSFSNAFLPAAYQGTPVGAEGTPAKDARIRNITNEKISLSEQRRQLDFLQAMNAEHRANAANDERLKGMIDSFELAYRMQGAVPEVMDISKESPETLKLYGIGEGHTDNFGRQCLMARRLAEAGVRFIQVTHGTEGGEFPGWDQHAHLKAGLEFNASRTDKPIAGLLADLKARGLLKDTLVLWGGEFGRTPVTEGRFGSFGRDHNPYGFTMWMAGGGVRGGLRYGKTDDYGYYATENKVHMHDLHATLLDLMGLDHEKLTYRYAGRDFRLTDVYGHVVKGIQA
jgi:hypothetical protein